MEIKNIINELKNKGETFRMDNDTIILHENIRIELLSKNTKKKHVIDYLKEINELHYDLNYSIELISNIFRCTPKYIRALLTIPKVPKSEIKRNILYSQKNNGICTIDDIAKRISYSKRYTRLILQQYKLLYMITDNKISNSVSLDVIEKRRKVLGLDRFQYLYERFKSTNKEDNIIIHRKRFFDNYGLIEEKIIEREFPKSYQKYLVKPSNYKFKKKDIIKILNIKPNLNLHYLSLYTGMREEHIVKICKEMLRGEDME